MRNKGTGQNIFKKELQEIYMLFGQCFVDKNIFTFEPKNEVFQLLKRTKQNQCVASELSRNLISSQINCNSMHR
jgi:hypothetical protein